jgi:prolyl-tRNA editing enzyme YbaK/EbsC (Cys-tRNA(Pro) deacylase)
VTGYAIGGIPPLGHATPMQVFIDRDLLAFDVVWAAAGTPRAVFAVSPGALADAIGARIVTVT